VVIQSSKCAGSPSFACSPFSKKQIKFKISYKSSSIETHLLLDALVY
jgi:hypothetical protein